ncbi:8-amino-7-oxononanoate synthase-like protein [Macroventuria anomochaeta]|uniref:8-amino-7-oxononanoate synthase-like protein n=1 Tax=Macroventuria anomochaeta TaxID=301207 RepID=A0ACB6SCX5_9PLEO|nr:8-amino-7-oxononanoate synthase-like protein [Macroventuria anomochaeta]KAF2631104.1 8-amino-7-oxononanoate synthase-like protein [Macroventuria anomochaeta]
MEGTNEKGPLDARMQCLLERRQTNSTLRNLTLPKAGQIDFSSNDFLSLSTNTQLKGVYLAELQTSQLPLGSGGSRLLDGNSPYAESLECDIAAFHGAEAGLLWNSGFDANAGFFSCVPQPGDVIVFDELVHASVHDGMRLSRAAQTVPFEHNSVADLRRVLSEVAQLPSRCNVFIAVESIYSMDGDVAPLRQIVDTVAETLGEGRGYIVVDEAHSTGVLGFEGRGLVCELGLEKQIFARLHTFGKALAGNGAILLGSNTLRHYLINYARPLIYTTFLSYPSLALIRSSYQLLRAGGTVPLQLHLHHLTEFLFKAMQQLHVTSAAARSLLSIPSACPQSPIFAVQLQRPRNLARYLQERGMMVRAVVSPTVPLGTERVRICLHAGNTVDEVETLVGALQEWSEEDTIGEKKQGPERMKAQL